MSSYSFTIKYKFVTATYEDIIKIYDFFERIYLKSAYRIKKYSIDISFCIGDVGYNCKNKQEFITEAIGHNNIRLRTLWLFIDNTISVYYDNDIGFYFSSESKLILDEFKKLIEDEINSEDKEEISTLITNINNIDNSIKIGSVQHIEGIIGNGNNLKLNTEEGIVNKKAWLEKYWIPILAAIIMAGGAIIAALI